MRTITICLVFTIFLSHACSKEGSIGNDNNDPENPFGLILEQRFEHKGYDDYQSECNVGLWMLMEDHIAHWKGVYDFELYEPINVLWIDYTACSQQEAKHHIDLFLENSGFVTRGFSSVGYHAFIDDQEVAQFPSDEVWSDHKNPFVENNHGRVFVSGNIHSGSTSQVYYTTASFSRETSYDHYFISFNQARDKLTLSANWIEEERVQWQNIYNPCDGLKESKEENYLYSTIDHDGTRVFVLYPG